MRVSKIQGTKARLCRTQKWSRHHFLFVIRKLAAKHNRYLISLAFFHSDRVKFKFAAMQQKELDITGLRPYIEFVRRSNSILDVVESIAKTLQRHRFLTPTVALCDPV
jgi:hypothetical protein